MTSWRNKDNLLIIIPNEIKVKMRQIHGLKQLCKDQRNDLSTKKLATLLIKDLADCYCLIYGSQQQILAKLNLIPNSLHYEPFDKRIDLAVEGKIRVTDSPPLTYHLIGNNFSLSGRCSLLPQICGVDLYLTHYQKNTKIAWQNFSFSVKKLYQE